jgi:hypothetical protein
LPVHCYLHSSVSLKSPNVDSLGQFSPECVRHSEHLDTAFELICLLSDDEVVFFLANVLSFDSWKHFEHSSARSVAPTGT